MKYQYFGDINDYRKYGLLRILSGGGEISAGVCWMLTPSDGLAHGQFVSYLDQPRRWRDFDSELFDFLYNCLRVVGERDVRLIENGSVLPATSFYTPVLTNAPGERISYFQGMLDHFRGVDLVFFDPDNGFEIKSTRFGRRGSSKFLYWHELAETYSAGHSVLVYQHFIREQRDTFTDRMAESIRAHTSNEAVIYSFRTPHVVFFLASRPEHAGHLARRTMEVPAAWGDQIQVSQHY
jgi:hypothetical protein